MLVAVVLPAMGQARFQFVKTGDKVFQLVSSTENDYSMQIIIASKGVFVAFQRPQDRISLQEFNVEELSPQTTTDLFLSYTNRYTELMTHKKRWTLRGNITLEIKEAGLTITVDGNNGYCTIRKNSLNSAKQAMLGIVGNQVVANVSEKLVPFLEANRYSDIIAPYRLTLAPSTSLKLHGQFIPSREPIGLSLLELPQNPCLSSPRVKFIPYKLYQRVLKTSDRTEAKQLLKKALRKTANPFDALIVLVQDEEQVVGIDPSNGQIKRIRPVGEKRTTCTIQ